MKRAILQFFIFWMLSSVASDLSKEKAGPYDIVGLSFNHCEDEGNNAISYTLKNKKLSMTLSAISMNITFKDITFGDNLTAKISVDQFTNNGWKVGYYKYEFSKVCSALQTYAKEFYDKLVRSMERTCPAPPGEYSFQDITLGNLQLPMFPTFFYNRYRMTVDIYDKDVKLGCFAVFGDLVPKRKPNKG